MIILILKLFTLTLRCTFYLSIEYFEILYSIIIASDTKSS